MEEIQEFVKLREKYERTLLLIGLELESMPYASQQQLNGAGGHSLADQLMILTDLTERGKNVLMQIETTMSDIREQIQKCELKKLQAQYAILETYLCSESDSDESLKSTESELAASSNAIQNRQAELDLHAPQVDMDEIIELSDLLEEQELAKKS